MAAVSSSSALTAPAASLGWSVKSGRSGEVYNATAASWERRTSSRGCSSSQSAVPLPSESLTWQASTYHNGLRTPSSPKSKSRRGTRRDMTCRAIALTEEDLRNSSPVTTLPSNGASAIPMPLEPTAGNNSEESAGGSYQPKLVWFAHSQEQEEEMINTAINGAFVGFAATMAATKVLTVDYDYWTGWTLGEILRNIPGHNWQAYESFLTAHPVLAKMVTSGIVYALGDWSAQCYQGRPFLSFDRLRLVRSGLVGFCLHGSLSHYYYNFCEMLFPSKDWWVVPAKVAFDQTIWSAIWNSTYYITLGMLRMEHPGNILKELRATFFPLLTAGWKLWPFAHIVTYGFVPLEQRLLWVDMVELVWVTILSMMANEQAESRKEDDVGSSDAGSQFAMELTLLCHGKDDETTTIILPAGNIKSSQD